MIYNYVFRSKKDGTLISALAHSLNQAREDAEKRNPPHQIHCSDQWMAWECWKGEIGIWYRDLDGDVHGGPRPK